MDQTLRQLERLASTGDQEALGSLRKARLRRGIKPWTERQIAAANFVKSLGNPQNNWNAIVTNPLEQTARILTGKDWSFSFDKALVPGEMQDWYLWYHRRCYPRLQNWAKRVLEESGNG